MNDAGIARVEPIHDHGVLGMADPGPQVRRSQQMDFAASMIDVADADEHVVKSVVEQHVGRPEMDFFPGRISGEYVWLLFPWRLSEAPGGGVREVPRGIVVPGERFYVSDTEEMPQAVGPLDETVVVDAPRFGLVRGGIVNPRELSSFQKGETPGSGSIGFRRVACRHCHVTWLLPVVRGLALSTQERPKGIRWVGPSSSRGRKETGPDDAGAPSGPPVPAVPVKDSAACRGFVRIPHPHPRLSPQLRHL